MQRRRSARAPPPPAAAEEQERAQQQQEQEQDEHEEDEEEQKQKQEEEWEEEGEEHKKQKQRSRTAHVQDNRKQKGRRTCEGGWISPCAGSISGVVLSPDSRLCRSDSCAKMEQSRIVMLENDFESLSRKGSCRLSAASPRGSDWPPAPMANAPTGRNEHMAMMSSRSCGGPSLGWRPWLSFSCWSSPMMDLEQPESSAAIPDVTGEKPPSAGVSVLV